MYRIYALKYVCACDGQQKQELVQFFSGQPINSTRGTEGPWNVSKITCHVIEAENQVSLASTEKQQNMHRDTLPRSFRKKSTLH